MKRFTNVSLKIEWRVLYMSLSNKASTSEWMIIATTKYKNFIIVRILSFSQSTIVWRPSSMDATSSLLDGRCFASHRWQLYLWSSDFSCCLTNESWIVEHPLPHHVREPTPPSLNFSYTLHFITPTIGSPWGFNQYNHQRPIFHLLLNLRKKLLGGFCSIMTSLESDVLCSSSTTKNIFVHSTMISMTHF